MKLYVASSWRNTRYDKICAALREAGHEILDWRATDTAFKWSAVDTDYQEWTAEEFAAALKHPVARAGFEKDRALMEAADACVLLLPCGKSAHLEAGWFAGRGKPLFVLLDETPEAELMYGFASDLVRNVGPLLDVLAGLVPSLTPQGHGPDGEPCLGLRCPICRP